MVAEALDDEIARNEDNGRPDELLDCVHCLVAGGENERRGADMHPRSKGGKDTSSIATNIWCVYVW